MLTCLLSEKIVLISAWLYGLIELFSTILMKTVTGIAEPFTRDILTISFIGLAIVFENPPAMYEKNPIGNPLEL